MDVDTKNVNNVNTENVNELNTEGTEPTEQRDEEKLSVENEKIDTEGACNKNVDITNITCNSNENNADNKNHGGNSDNVETILQVGVKPIHSTCEENSSTPITAESDLILNGTENDEINKDCNVQDKLHDEFETPTTSSDNTTETRIDEDSNAITNDLWSLSSNIINGCPKNNDLADKGKCSKSNEDSVQVISSEVQVQKPVENTGLGAIAAEYNSFSEDSENESGSESVELVPVNQSITNEHRAVPYIISSDSDSDTSDVEVVSVASKRNEIIDIDGNDEENEISGKPRGPIRAKGEMLLEDLPPIQDLHITVPEQECIELGKVNSIIDQLILVDCIPGTVTLDLDTVLFLEKGNKVLGEVFDVIGQVSNPLYCVRFNSNKQIKEKGIEVGQTVYVAPRTEHTRFLILSNLTTIRGSDASWENDVEPPESHIDYSDDEEERNARRNMRSRRPRSENGDEVKKEPRAKKSQPNRYQQRHVSQERQMYDNISSYDPGQIQQHQQESFQYNPTNTTWHNNYSQPPNMLPNPFSQQFNTAPGYNTPTAGHSTFNNYSPFDSPINSRDSSLSRNQNSSYSSNLNPFNVGFSHTQYMSPPPANQNASSSHYGTLNHYGPQWMPPDQSNNSMRYDYPHQ